MFWFFVFVLIGRVSVLVLLPTFDLSLLPISPSTGGLPLAAFNLGKVRPYQRGFFCNDDSIKYPFHHSTITSTVLYTVGFALPISCVSRTFWASALEDQLGRTRLAGMFHGVPGPPLWYGGGFLAPLPGKQPLLLSAALVLFLSEYLPPGRQETSSRLPELRQCICNCLILQGKLETIACSSLLLRVSSEEDVHLKTLTQQIR